jgi:hypothetical protein
MTICEIETVWDEALSRIETQIWRGMRTIFKWELSAKT